MYVVRILYKYVDLGSLDIFLPALSAEKLSCGEPEFVSMWVERVEGAAKIAVSAPVISFWPPDR